MSKKFKYDVFLSYSSKDEKTVLQIAERLRDDGVQVWLDKWEIKAGDHIPTKVDKGLEQSRKLVLCLSSNSSKSDWAKLESNTIRFRDPLNTDGRLIPLRLDTTPVKDSLRTFLYISWLPGDRENGYKDLLKLCKPESETFSPAHGSQPMRKSYLDVQMYREKWDKKEPIQSVTMVHVSGGVFRQQRTRWQMDRANKLWPRNLPMGGDVKTETRDEMNRRLKVELEGAEPWPATLAKLRVFIGNENKFIRWKKANNRPMEKQEASRLFWIGYLRKLKELYDALNYGTNRQFVPELYQIERSDFYAHVFNGTKSDGHIVGCNLCADWDWPTAYQVFWPRSKGKPEAFSNIENAIERMRKDSSICKPIKL